MKKKSYKKKRKELDKVAGVLNTMLSMTMTGIQFYQVISGVRNPPPTKKPADRSSEIQDVEAEVISSTIKK